MELYDLERRLKDPKGFKNDIIKYMIAQGAQPNIEKSISSVVWYHEQIVPLATLNAEYFTGQFIQSDTNIESNFTPKQDEHSIITGIRIFQGDDTTTVSNSAWGDLVEPKLQNGQFTITSNGIVVVKNMSMRDALVAQTGKFQGLIPLKELVFWQGQTELKLNVTFKGANLADLALRFELVGVGLVS